MVRLRVLRMARGLSLAGLAAEMGGLVTKQAIAKYEAGTAKPSHVVWNELARALGVKAYDLFEEPAYGMRSVAYRAVAGLPRRERDRVESLAQVEFEKRLRIRDLIGEGGSLEPPCQSIPVETSEDAEEAAAKVRKRWKLGAAAPIASVTDVLESNRVQVIEVDVGEGFDGLSLVAQDGAKRTSGAIVSGKVDSGERQRLNLAHELGHLMCRLPENATADEEERLAFRFGGAFLAPADSVRKDLGASRSYIGWTELLLLKKRYGMSLQALIYRCKDLGIVTQSYYNSLFQEIKRLGWKRSEPEVLPLEEPTWFRRSVLRAVAEGVLAASEAESLGFDPEEVIPLSLQTRKRFLQLPAAERDRLIRESISGELAAYYKDNEEVREWEEADAL